jgi:ubiquinone/menaquinone biosynthesis C-methylase UbiE
MLGVLSMSERNEVNKEKRNFDKEAANWDQIPGRVKVAKDIAETMIREIALTPDMDVLDFGCGTGLLTLVLQPFVRTITGGDSSTGMLNVLNSKINEQNLRNVQTKYLDLDRGDVITGSYHLVVSSMTLHHIKDIGSLVKQFYGVLQPSGKLVVADLDLDDGQFHSENNGVFHFGFDRDALRGIFENAGFYEVRVQKAAQIEKPIGDGKTRLFTMFLLIGRK